MDSIAPKVTLMAPQARSAARIWVPRPPVVRGVDEVGRASVPMARHRRACGPGRGRHRPVASHECVVRSRRLAAHSCLSNRELADVHR